MSKRMVVLVSVLVAFGVLAGPVAPGSAAGPAALSISAGSFHTCEVRGDGAPVCWGTAFTGAIDVPAGIGTVTQVSAGFVHSCAIKTDGTPVCWGPTGPIAAYVDGGQGAVPSDVGTVTQISAGKYNTCAVKTDGTPVCWGYLGPINSAGDTMAPPAGIGTVTQISTEEGARHACAVKTDGTPVCWGLDDDGQADVPAGIGAVSQISVGGAHTCAVKTDKTVVCWGSDHDGQTDVPAGLGTVSQLSAGAYNTCVIKTDGTPVCWGAAAHGVLAIPAGIGAVSQISTGRLHACAVKVDGTPVCWGTNDDGQLDIPGADDTTAPTTTDDVPSGYSAGPVTVTLTATDNPGGGGVASVRYLVGANPADPSDPANNPLTYDPANKPVLQDGQKIRYSAIDFAGNAETARTSAAVQVDGTPPSTSDNVPATYGNAPVTVTLTATDAASGVASIRYLVGTNPADPAVAANNPLTYDPMNKPVLQDGQKIRYSAVDNVGNAETAKTSAAAKVDTTAPSTSDDVPATYGRTPVTVTLTATDAGSGVATIKYLIGTNPADPSVPANKPLTYNPAAKPVLTNGRMIRYFAVDNVGNAEMPKLSAPAKVDVLAPTTTDNVPATLGNAPVSVKLTAVDAGGAGVAAIRYLVGTSPADPSVAANNPLTYDPSNRPVLQDGQRIRYSAIDTAGNAEAPKLSAAAQVLTPPTFVASSNGPSSRSLSTSLTGSARAGSTVRIFATANCSGAPVATGAAAAFAAPGLGVTVAPGASATYSTNATDSGVTSPCSPTTLRYTNLTVAVSAGGYHTCALPADGTPVCWGDNTDGGLLPAPTGLGPANQISAGRFLTCAIKVDGTPVCWGQNLAGEATVPAGIGPVTQISAGAYFACAVKADGTPVCWGISNDTGQTDVPAGIGPVIQVSAARWGACAVRVDGTPVCWGRKSSPPVPAGIGPVTQISTADDFMCAVKVNGTPVCWGGISDQLVPKGIGPVTQISVNGSRVCAVKVDGTAVCWGGAPPPPAGLGPVTQISNGLGHTCAVKSGGSISCWGANERGQAAVPGALSGLPAPAAPVFTGPATVGPSRLLNTVVAGTAKAGSTVRLFTTADCSGAPVATASAAAFASPGITVTLPANATTTLRATATDGNGVSPCSTSTFTYINDSIAPARPTLTGFAPRGAKNSYKLVGSAEALSRVQVYATPDCSGPVVIAASAEALASPGLNVPTPAGATSTFTATATDAAGNTSACSAPRQITLP